MINQRDNQHTFEDPLVSIIIPAFNAERYLMDAVRSAQSQSHGNLEIIIVDDGSTDGTRELTTRCARDDSRIQVITKPNSGLSSARNAGAERSAGRYVCFLDSDDTLHPVKILRQVAALERTGAGLAFCDYITTDNELVPLTVCETRPKTADIRDQLPLQNVFPPHAALVRREVLDRVGPFDESLSRAEDWDYWIRCADVTRMVHVPGALCTYRRHDKQLHNDRRPMRLHQLRVIHKNYEAGSQKANLALAGMHMGDAKYFHGEGHFARTVYHLARVALLARSPAKTLQVIRIAGFG